jgi:hypothetical protein
VGGGLGMRPMAGADAESADVVNRSPADSAVEDDSFELALEGDPRRLEASRHMAKPPATRRPPGASSSRQLPPSLQRSYPTAMEPCIQGWSAQR